MATKKSTGKKGNKKHGRMKKKPSHIRYNAENRREKNKLRRMARIKRKMERKARRRNA